MALGRTGSSRKPGPPTKSGPGLTTRRRGIVSRTRLSAGWSARRASRSAVGVATTQELEQEFKTALGADTTTVIVVRTPPQQAML
ncbi:MAG TPA: hypothetical protein VME19_02815 [Streptosporangiaceae bacterium]|nr:hypothetical protein [Streptosporangiaceae bacterium]